MTLWHFTCDHGHRGLGRRGTLRPHPHPLMPTLAAMVWLTDDPNPDRDDVGLTSDYIRCDRMAYRYRVHAPHAVPWKELRDHVGLDVIADLESYGQPQTWWVSFEPCTAVLA